MACAACSPRRYAESYDWHESGRQHRALLEQAVMGHRRR
jgi:hypothetical protein